MNRGASNIDHFLYFFYNSHFASLNYSIWTKVRSVWQYGGYKIRKMSYLRINISTQRKLLHFEKDPPVCSWILVWSVTKLGWKRKTLLYVPEFWYGRWPNWGEKERPSCRSLNFGMVSDQIGVKKKNTLCRNSRPRLGRELIPGEHLYLDSGEY